METSEAQKRATKKYRESNKEKVNEQRKKYYNERKDKDPDFLEYKRNKAREYYQKKKAQAQKSEESDEPEKEEEIFIEPPKTPEIPTDIPVEIPEENTITVKKTRKPRVKIVDDTKPPEEPEKTEEPEKPTRTRKPKKTLVMVSDSEGKTDTEDCSDIEFGKSPPPETLPLPIHIVEEKPKKASKSKKTLK